MKWRVLYICSCTVAPVETQAVWAVVIMILAVNECVSVFQILQGEPY